MPLNPWGISSVTRTPDIRHGDVDGVAVRWIESAAPFTATLMFRVGPIDERLKTAGVTHLSEHLALDPLRDVLHPFNGEVHPDYTAFWASGDPDDVTAFLARLCRSLADLDTSRLQAEARVLAAESWSAPVSTHAEILRVWFGPNGPGLLGSKEHGLGWMGPTHVGSWAGRYFTNGNAILTLTGPPPQDLRLPLPDGEYRPVAMPQDDVGYRPDRMVKLRSHDRGICLGTVAQRSVPLVMGLDVLGHRLRRRLRHELALVYGIEVRYQPLFPDQAYVYLATDSEERNSGKVSHVFMETIRELGEHGPTAPEMERARRDVANDSLDPTTLAKAELNRLAHDELVGHPLVTLDEGASIRNTTSPQAVQEAVAATFARGLVIAPESYDDGLEPRPMVDHAVFAGKRFRAMRAAANGVKRLVIGDEGVSARIGDRWVSIPYADLALVTMPSDGVRHLHSRTGSWMELSTDGWWRGREVIQRLDEHLPPETVIPPRRPPA